MSWKHPDMSLEQFMKLVKGFVDILILLSGYQSSGRLAHWDSLNVNKVFQWGLFFENGLAHISTATLSVARRFVLEHLFHGLPLQDAHLRALLTATVEMDLEELSESEHDSLNVYLSKLKLQETPIQESAVLVRKDGNCDGDGDGLMKYAVQKLMKRWSAVSSVSTVEIGLDVVCQSVRHSSRSEFDDGLRKEQLKHENAPV